MNQLELGIKHKGYGLLLFSPDLPKAFPVEGIEKSCQLTQSEEAQLFGAATRRIEREAAKLAQFSEDNSGSEYSHLVPELCCLGVHEVGHAIVAVSLGWMPSFVSACPSLIGDGINRYSSVEPEDFSENLPDDERPRYLEAEIAMKAGAIVSESMILPARYLKHIRSRASQDFYEAMDLALRLVGPLPESSDGRKKACLALSEILQTAVGTAREIIRANRLAAIELACGVIEKGELRGKEISSILERHGVRRRTPWSHLVAQASEALEASSG